MYRKVLFVTDWQKIDITKFETDRTSKSIVQFELEHWSCKKKLNNNLLYRWYCYFNGAVYLICNRKKYDTIIIWQQMIGFVYFIINFFLPFTRHKNVVVTTILFTTNKNGIYGSVQKILIQLSLRYAKGLIWFSSQMANDVRNSFPDHELKIFNTKMPVFSKMKTNKLNNKIYDPRFNNGIFCGGKSFRDFNIVIKAFKDTNIPLTIVCTDNEKITEKNITGNIRILRFSEVPPDQYYALLDKSFCTVVSLKDDKSSCGQLTFSYAMGNGIPVIATNSYGVRDYVKDRQTGLLFSLGKSDEIRSAYDNLRSDVDFKNQIIENARKIDNIMTPKGFVEHVILLTQVKFSK